MVHGTRAETIGKAGHVRRIGVLLIAAGLLAFASAPAARGADRIYWGNGNDTISYANLDGTGGGLLNLTGATPSGPRGVAIDAAAGRIYWANQGNDTISYANLDGSGGGGQLNITGATAVIPHGLAIDPGAGRIYWANDDNTMAYANLDGSGGGLLDLTGSTPSEPYGTVIDPVAGRIYWANRITNTISYANLDGTGGGGELDITGAPSSKPHGVTIDRASGRIFWTNLNSTIGYANADGTGGGGQLSTAGGTQSGGIGMAIDPVVGQIYWGNLGFDSISYANLDGSGGGGLLNISGASPSDPRFVAILRAPAGTGAPQVAGGTAPGAVLSCSGATWAPDLLESFLYRVPESVAFQWTRDGAEVAGATDSSYTAYAPGDYRCRVTATNAAGSTSQTSDPHTVPAPPETMLTQTKVDRSRQRVTFGFEAIGDASGFRCRFKRPGRPVIVNGCRSEKIYKNLRPGRYQFVVRAFGPGGHDVTPVRKRLTIR